MKKLVLVAAALIVLGQSVLAQDVVEPIDRVDTRVTVNRIRFGAYIAPNMSWMRPTATKSDDGQFDVSKNGTKIGFMYGLMAEYYFARNYAIVTGLQVNTTGGKINTKNINQSDTMSDNIRKADFDYRLQFLEIPIALKLRTDNISGFKFFGQLGVTLGINIGKKASYSVNYYDVTTHRDSTATGDMVKLTGGVGAIAPIMLQMNVGGGVEYPINNKLTAYFGLFFNNGFTPDATAPQKYDNDRLHYKGEFRDANTRLNNFSLRVGLFF